MEKNKIVKTVYIFGNPDLESDNLPVRVVPRLKALFPRICFMFQDPNENIKPDQNGELTLIDTVQGIDNVTIFRDIDTFEDEPKYSLHDFDLGFQLKLLKKIGLLKNIKILGVPPHLSEQEAVNQLSKYLKPIEQ